MFNVVGEGRGAVRVDCEVLVHGTGGGVVEVGVDEAGAAVFVPSLHLALVFKADRVAPEPVRDALFLKRLHVVSCQSADLVLVPALAVRIGDVALILLDRLELRDGDVRLWVKQEQVYPDFRKFWICMRKLIDDFANEARLAVGALDPVRQLRRLALDLLDDAEPKRMEGFDTAFQLVQLNTELPRDPFPELIGGGPVKRQH
ncbi:hypothetical protein D3C71_991410 [compost metagenome]